MIGCPDIQEEPGLIHVKKGRKIMDQIKSSSIYIQVAIAVLLYNLLYIFSWELPLAIKLDWGINVIGDIFIIAISIMSIILISWRKKIGLLTGMIPAFWAIFLQWFLVYIIADYKEPNGVWWHPIFPIFQGIMIVFFSILAYKDDNLQHKSGLEITKGLKSPSIYLYAISGFLLAHTGKKIVCEMVVGFRDAGIRGMMSVILVMLIAIIAVVMVLKRMKWGVWLAIFLGVLVMIQPIVYHIILGKPCLSGIWWYPIFTAIQGVFIVYFSLQLFLNERKITDQIHS
jgi:hypothetical protein